MKGCTTMFEKFSESAREVVRAGVEEARRGGDRRVGTDHLLLGLLADADIATLLSIGVEDGRQMASTLDRRALEAIGLDIGDYPLARQPATGLRTPLTAGAREIIGRTLALAVQERSRNITSEHILRAILERDVPDAAAALLTALGVDRVDIARRLDLHGGNPLANSA
jgi:ATP-dependent Clp protease ATP-binding subunit ClpA